MADRLRRSKDIIKSNVTKYLESTTSGSYLAYFEGSPTYITYYQLDSAASLQDVGLETVNSLVGKNTPNKYKKIQEVPVWGVNALDVSNELSERGLLANVNGELLFIPNTVRPYAGDFFVFEYEGLTDHLFRINDVQYDKISPKKYFRAQYSLYPNNADEIFDNISQEYICKYDPTTGEASVVESSNAASQDLIQSITDGLIEKYTSLFYDEDMDSFVLHGEDDEGKETCYWSPYLQHFLHETKALDRYEVPLLSEIYINDVNEVDNGDIYNELAYRKSLFRSVEMQDNELNFDMNFLCVPDFNLKMVRNLPFFMSPLNYKLVTPIVKHGKDDPSAYLNAFPVFFSKDKLNLFRDTDHYHKVHKMDELHLTRIEPYLKDKDIIYECNRHELEPTAIAQAIVDNDSVYINSIGIDDLMTDADVSNNEDLFLFTIIRDYLNKNFVASDEKLEKLNKMYYHPDVSTYMLMPLVVYILKQSLKA